MVTVGTVFGSSWSAGGIYECVLSLISSEQLAIHSEMPGNVGDKAGAVLPILADKSPIPEEVPLVSELSLTVHGVMEIVSDTFRAGGDKIVGVLVTLSPCRRHSRKSCQPGSVADI